MEEIPEWAVEKAHSVNDETDRTDKWSRTFAALLRYVVAHEQPPEDPLLAEVRELVAQFFNYDEHDRANALDGTYDLTERNRLAMTALRRGIEIGRAG